VAEAAIPHDLVAAELLDVVVDSPRRTGDDAACSESFARCRAASSIGRHGVRRVRWVLWVSSTQGRFFPSEKRVIQDAYGTQAACQDAMTRFRTTATLLLDSGTHAGTPILVPDDMLKSRPPGDDDYQVTFWTVVYSRCHRAVLAPPGGMGLRCSPATGDPSRSH
jgi:hypothetical protein